MAIKVGEIINGTVTGITNFGAFVKIGDNETGLVHISEVSHDYVNDIKEVLKVGQAIKVKVIDVDGNGKISLSIRQAVKKAFRKPDEIDWTKADKKQKSLSFEDKVSMFLKDSNERQDGMKNKLKEVRKSKKTKRG